MAVPFDPTDPARLTPAERLDALAAILAAGVRRALAARPPEPLKSEPESPADGLDPAAEQSVHAPRG